MCFAFRSLVAAKAILLDLLSVGAGHRVVVPCFLLGDSTGTCS
jgi:hypothetical protein